MYLYHNEQSLILNTASSYIWSYIKSSQPKLQHIHRGNTVSKLTFRYGHHDTLNQQWPAGHLCMNHSYLSSTNLLYSVLPTAIWFNCIHAIFSTSGLFFSVFITLPFNKHKAEGTTTPVPRQRKANCQFKLQFRIFNVCPSMSFCNFRNIVQLYSWLHPTHSWGYVCLI